MLRIAPSVLQFKSLQFEPRTSLHRQFNLDNFGELCIAVTGQIFGKVCISTTEALNNSDLFIIIYTCLFAYIERRICITCFTVFLRLQRWIYNHGVWLTKLKLWCLFNKRRYVELVHNMVIFRWQGLPRNGTTMLREITEHVIGPKGAITPGGIQQALGNIFFPRVSAMFTYI